MKTSSISIAYREQIPNSKTASVKGTLKQKDKQQYTFKAFLKSLIILQSTMSVGKEFHILIELVKNELKKAEVLAKVWTNCFS